jgi:MYXO-CTERM domain-containing protein
MRKLFPRDAGPDTETTVRDDAGGCAAAPNAPSSVWASFAIGVALVVASRRKRR